MPPKSHHQNEELVIPLLAMWFRILLTLLAIGGILYFSVKPAPGTGSISHGPFGLLPFSMWLHFVAYLGLAVIIAYASGTVSRPTWQVLFGVFIVTVACGMIAEMLQLTLPSRTFDPLDMVVNGIGAAAGVSVWYLFITVVELYRQPRRRM